MRGKTWQCVLTVCLAVGLGGTAVYAVDSPETLRKIEMKRKLARRGVLARWQAYRDLRDYRKIPMQDAYQPKPLSEYRTAVVDDIATGTSFLSVLDADTIPSPGVAIGITSYDSQADFAIGREIGSRPGSETVHMSWMMCDVVPEGSEFYRLVNYNSWDTEYGSTNQGFNGTSVSLGEFADGGFCRGDVDGSSLWNLVLHQRIELGFPYSAWYLEFPIEGSGLHLDNELAKPGLFPDEVEMLWPDVAVEQNPNGGNVDDIVHVISMGAVEVGGDNADPSDRIWYYRFDRGGLWTWEGPVLIDSTRSLSYTIDADDNSNNVCVAFTSDYSTDGFNGLNNIAYRESATSGVGWITGAELGPTNKNFATSYSESGGPQAWTETSVLYDHSGDLHILFTEQRVANESEHIALKHWSKSRGMARTVQIAYYDNDATWARTLNLGHISLGVGDGSTLCRGGIESNEDYLYACYIKLGGETPEEEQDMSQLGYANGELWLTGSNSGGFTWSPAVNLSNTRFPECTSRHPDSTCTSEAWSSMARDVRDIEIFYIYDFEPGAFDEAPWTMNRAMYLNLPGGTVDAQHVCPIIAPSFASYTSSIPECEYHADPGGVNMEELTILNLGNDGLNGEVSVTQGYSWLSVTDPGSYTIIAGGNDIVMGVTMSAVGLSEGLYIGEIQVTHNDTSKVSPRVFPIEFFVVTDFKCPQANVLKTAVASPGVLSLEIGSNGRFGSQNDEGGLWRFLDSSSAIFDASLLVAYGPQPMPTGDTIVFHRFYNRPDPGQGGLSAVTDLVIDTSAYTTGNGYAKASCQMRTHADGLSPDSAIGIAAEYFFPQSPVYGDFVIAKYTVWNRTASPINDVVLALWADLDIIEAAHMDALQRGVDNHGNYVQAQNLIYQYGYDTVGHTPSNHLNSVQRYSGGVTYISGRDATGDAFMMTQAPIRGAVDDNRDNTQPLRPNSRFFYSTMVGSPGVSIWEPVAHRDSAKDCYTWLLLDQGRTLAANGANPGVYVVAWLSDTLQHDAYDMTPKLAGGLREVCDSAWSWAAQNVYCSCPCHADPQCDGTTNVLDVVLTVNVAFRGASPTFDDGCPYERTDVDCDGHTDVVDECKVVDVAFRGATPEESFCDPCAEGSAQVTAMEVEPEGVSITSPGNSVVVESKSVPTGATGVQIGVYLENDVELSSMVMPLEFRTVSNGAYVNGTFSVVVNPYGRMIGSGLEDFATRLYFNTPSAQLCSGPVSLTWTGGGGTPNADGSPDAYLYVGSVTLSQFLSPGSDGPGSPSFVITFSANGNPGEFEIDTCCTAPGNHLIFLDHSCIPILPTFTKGIVTLLPDITECNRTTTDRYLLTCPRGDILFNVNLRDPGNNPIAGYSNVYLDFSACGSSELIPQPGAYPSWPIVPAPAPSDAEGTIRFAIAAGGDCADCMVTVHTGCGYSRTVPVHSVDVNGDGCVLPNDWDEIFGLCCDFNADGVVNDVDYTRHAAHCCDHCFPAGPGDWLGQHLALVPDGGFEAGDTVMIYWQVDNNAPLILAGEEKETALGAWRIDSVAFFQGEQGVDPTWEWLTSRTYGTMLPTGSSLADSIKHIVPEYRDICILARLYSDCCAEPLLEKLCSSVERECPPGALCYEFYTRRLEEADELSTQWSDNSLLYLGWSYVLKDTVIDMPVPTLVKMTRICTSELSAPGSSGTLTIYYRVGTLWDHFSYRVLQDYFAGDICGGANRASDCKVDVLDVVCLVDYIFRGGPPPDPPTHADINLDGTHDVLDVVRLVDYVFRGGDPPPDPYAGPQM